jgi:hypothetical protein
MVSRINGVVTHQPAAEDSQARIVPLPIGEMARLSDLTGLMPIDLRWIALPPTGWSVTVRTIQNQVRNPNARTIESDQMLVDQMLVDRKRSAPNRTDLIPSAAVSDHFPRRAPIAVDVRHRHRALSGRGRPKTGMHTMLMIVLTVNAPTQRSQRDPPLECPERESGSECCAAGDCDRYHQPSCTTSSVTSTGTLTSWLNSWNGWGIANSRAHSDTQAVRSSFWETSSTAVHGSAMC